MFVNTTIIWSDDEKQSEDRQVQIEEENEAHEEEEKEVQEEVKKKKISCLLSVEKWK